MRGRIAEPPPEETAESPEMQQLLHSISSQLRRLAPGDCCVHGEVFCLSCGIDWAVTEQVPLRLDSEEDGIAS